jgi:hypothetical protein
MDFARMMALPAYGDARRDRAAVTCTAAQRPSASLR